MPHVTVKLIAGPSPEQLEKAAKQIQAVLQETLGKPTHVTSVAVEEYTAAQWPDVYDECIEGNPNLVIKPGYPNPRG